MVITLYHYPKCSTSRTALEMLSERGVEPVVVEYMRTGWDEATLRRLGERSGRGVRGLLRTKEPAAAGLGEADDAALIAAMIAEPVLVERPILETEKGVRLGRPPEAILEIL